MSYYGISDISIELSVRRKQPYTGAYPYNGDSKSEAQQWVDKNNILLI